MVSNVNIHPDYKVCINNADNDDYGNLQILFHYRVVEILMTMIQLMIWMMLRVYDNDHDDDQMMMLIMKHMFDDDDKMQGSATYHQADIALLTLAKEVNIAK